MDKVDAAKKEKKSGTLTLSSGRVHFVHFTFLSTYVHIVHLRPLQKAEGRSEEGKEKKIGHARGHGHGHEKNEKAYVIKIRG